MRTWQGTITFSAKNPQRGVGKHDWPFGTIFAHYTEPTFAPPVDSSISIVASATGADSPDAGERRSPKKTKLALDVHTSGDSYDPSSSGTYLDHFRNRSEIS